MVQQRVRKLVFQVLQVLRLEAERVDRAGIAVIPDDAVLGMRNNRVGQYAGRRVLPVQPPARKAVFAFMPLFAIRHKRAIAHTPQFQLRTAG